MFRREIWIYASPPKSLAWTPWSFEPIDMVSHDPEVCNSVLREILRSFWGQKDYIMRKISLFLTDFSSLIRAVERKERIKSVMKCAYFLTVHEASFFQSAFLHFFNWPVKTLCQQQNFEGWPWSWYLTVHLRFDKRLRSQTVYSKKGQTPTECGSETDTTEDCSYFSAKVLNHKSSPEWIGWTCSLSTHRFLDRMTNL